MRVLLLALGTAAVLATAILMVSALVAGARAVRIGGARLLVNGIAWFLPPPDLPPEARPHMRRALLCWLGAMGCMALAGLAFGVGGALA
ncbi:hypothetical protein [Roseomonas sp. CECT 9278]|uniref:hypothetical protein n=1 Tax=Roseomonas sp. CECT 9278 TaxID=2845823 RepID=UPI001E488C4D|nr:hypothetical protein [Roseomonas sp. CECT 9278]CAH0256500.1 hypothetical protein ROS9278_03283 [Roseomonas sp. CECT 9278]